MRVLVVEDDKRMAQMLSQALEEECHAVTIAYDGRDAVDLAGKQKYDLMILDVMLPGMDGLAIARHLRAERNDTPILMLTARDAVADIVSGLDTGADDYLTKPFSLEVLLARVRAVGRHGASSQSSRLQVEDLVMDLDTHEVHRAGKSIHLTRTEFTVLELLVRAAGRVLSRDMLLESVWGAEDVESNTLDAFIRLLRGKIERPGEAKLIQTVRGIGYCIRREE